MVGGGIVGMAVAWRARRRGMKVTVLERDVAGAGTSRVAAGMLAPVVEVEFGDAGRRVLELGLRSLQLWPAFASDLQESTGASVGLMRTGTLLVARDEDEARELERQLAFRRSLGLEVARLRPSEAREREPALRPDAAACAGGAGRSLGRPAPGARRAAPARASPTACSCASMRGWRASS